MSRSRRGIAGRRERQGGARLSARHEDVLGKVLLDVLDAQVSTLTEHVVEHRRQCSAGTDADFSQICRQLVGGFGHFGPCEECHSTEKELFVRPEVLRGSFGHSHTGS